MCIDERIKFNYEGGGKPVKGSLFHDDLSLHEAGVAEGVHEVDPVFHGWCFHKVFSVSW
jgi:hypothetical protein